VCFYLILTEQVRQGVGSPDGGREGDAEWRNSEV
jgi:hypothetical protein